MDNKYTKGYEDKAWASMKDLLDQEMPEKKKRRSLFLLLFPVLFVISGFVLWYTLPGLNSTSNMAVVQNPLKNKVVLPEVINETADSKAIPNVAKTLHNNETNPSTTTPQIETTPPTKATTPTFKAIEKETFESVPKAKPSFSKAKIKEALEIAETMNGQERADYLQSAIRSLPTKSFPSFIKESKPVYRPIFFRTIKLGLLEQPIRIFSFGQPRILGPNVRLEKNKAIFAISFGAAYKSNIERKLNGLGVSVSPTLSFKKFFLEAGISLYSLNSSYKSDDFRLLSEDSNNEDLQTLDNFIYTQRYAEVLNKEIELNTSLGIGKRLNSVWSTSLGIQFRRILDHRSSDELIGLNAGNGFQEKELLLPSHYWGPYLSVQIEPISNLKARVQIDYNTPNYLYLKSEFSNWKRNAFLSAGLLYNF